MMSVIESTSVPSRSNRMAGGPEFGILSMMANQSELRRRTLILFGSVVLLDVVVIAIYYAMHIRERPIKTQQMFIAAWVVATLAVVVPQMKEIRKFRRPRS